MVYVYVEFPCRICFDCKTTHAFWRSDDRVSVFVHCFSRLHASASYAGRGGGEDAISSCSVDDPRRYNTHNTRPCDVAATFNYLLAHLLCLGQSLCGHVHGADVTICVASGLAPLCLPNKTNTRR